MSSECVLVTGDAGAIGSATVDVFLDSGFTVVGLDRVERGGSADRHVRLQADVTDQGAVVAALGYLEDAPPLTHVIAVAGGALPSEPTTQDDPTEIRLDDYLSSIELNLVSQFITVQAALPWLRRAGAVNKSIALTSSFNAISAQGMPGYSSAKAGLIGLMNSLVRPMGLEGVRINTVAPGTIRTPRTERIWAHVPGHFERLGNLSALGHVGEPADVARVFRSLALDMTHVTGQVVVVDGGQSGRPVL